MRSLVLGLLISGATTAPALGRAQPNGPSRGIDVYGGWQAPLVTLRSDSITARRTGAFVFGAAGYLRANRPMLWRVSGDVALTSLIASGSAGGAPSRTRRDRPEYSVGLDAAPRVLAGQFLGRSADLRLYGGTAVRRISTNTFLVNRQQLCLQADGVCLGAINYRTSVGPVVRAGALLTFQGAGVRTRIDVAYHLSKPWHVVQHDLRVALRYGPG